MTNQTNPIEVYRSPTEFIRMDENHATGLIEGKRFIVKLNPANLLATYFRWHKNKNPLSTPPLSNEGAKKLLNAILKRIPETEALHDARQRIINIQNILSERIDYLKEGYHNISEGNRNEKEVIEKKKALKEAQLKEEYAEKTAQRKAQKEALKKERLAQLEQEKNERRIQNEERIKRQREEMAQKALLAEKERKLQARKRLFQRILDKNTHIEPVYEPTEQGGPQFFGKLGNLVYYICLDSEKPQFLSVDETGTKPLPQSEIGDVMEQINTSLNKTGDLDEMLNQFAVSYYQFAQQTKNNKSKDETEVLNNPVCEKIVTGDIFKLRQNTENSR